MSETILLAEDYMVVHRPSKNRLRFDFAHILIKEAGRYSGLVSIAKIKLPDIIITGNMSEITPSP
jgi:hypothetical protein